MKNSSRLAKLLGSIAAALAIVVGVTVPALAATSYQVSGDVNKDANVVLTYSTYRPHSAYGSLNFLLQSGQSGVRFNFKSSSGGTVGWGSYLNPGQQYEWRNVLAGNYAFQVQRQTTCTLCGTGWAGVYTS